MEFDITNIGYCPVYSLGVIDVYGFVLMDSWDNMVQEMSLDNYIQV